MQGDQLTGFHTQTGIWLDADFPRVGWSFLEMEEAHEEDRLCEACRNARERYLHRLENVQFGLTLLVGRACAERLESDSYGPEKRERLFRDDQRVISDWPRRVWQTSKQGNPYINSRGYNVSIWRKGAGYGVTIRVQNRFGKEFALNGEDFYATVEDAKQGALTAVLYARKKFRDTN